MRSILLFTACLLSSFFGLSQYKFSSETKLECTEVKNQARTGTCWSFATASFIESELIKAGKGKIDLSEMYVVRNIYEDKAHNYVLRQGKANFSQGSLAHDLIRMMAKNGVVPDDAYSGLVNQEKAHNHSEMEAGLKGFLDGILKQKKLSSKWKPAFNAVLDIYLGLEPTYFKYNGQRYSAIDFAKSLELKADNYLSISSFTHHPFYEPFILEIPDNYSNGAFHNVPLGEMIEIVDHAISQGYTIAWDGDVSEKGFNAKEGIAVLPQDAKREDLFTSPDKEILVNQNNRQENFESFSTTDDHLMHIIGTAKDQKGTKYYIIKNSWGEISRFKGYMYMSEAYFKMKTVGILINKNALPPSIEKKLSNID